MKTLLAIALAFFAWTASASAAVVTWNSSGPVTPVPGYYFFNSDLFDGAQMEFTPFFASSLDDVQADEENFYHSHGDETFFSMALLIDGSWTTVWTDTLDNAASALADDIANPGSAISFAGGMVGGIRFLSEPANFIAYHFEGGPPVFLFSGEGEPAPVPAPAALALLAFGLAGLRFSRQTPRHA